MIALNKLKTLRCFFNLDDRDRLLKLTLCMTLTEGMPIAQKLAVLDDLLSPFTKLCSIKRYAELTKEMRPLAKFTILSHFSKIVIESERNYFLDDYLVLTKCMNSNETYQVLNCFFEISSRFEFFF